MFNWEIYELLKHAPPLRKVCTDEDYTYFELVFNAQLVMYRQNTMRPDGRRLFKLNDDFAKALGFYSYDSLRLQVDATHGNVQWWRGWMSLERLRELL